MLILPRQARDKHRENSKKRRHRRLVWRQQLRPRRPFRPPFLPSRLLALPSFSPAGLRTRQPRTRTGLKTTRSRYLVAADNWYRPDSNPAVFIPQRRETGRPVPIQILRLIMHTTIRDEIQPSCLPCRACLPHPCLCQYPCRTSGRLFFVAQKPTPRSILIQIKK
eukprot:COSAG06_NODE_1693_length_8701_cov_80.626133_9_plen_165_part_00